MATATMLTNAIRTTSLTTARRLAILRQHLAGPRPASSTDAIMEILRDIGCLQIDPINVVARSSLLVLWSRLGPYDPALLDTLLWQERRLFEYWAHAASIVLTEDYQIHNLLMRQYGQENTAWSQRARDWMEQNESLREHILTTLEQQGPLRSRFFEDKAIRAWQSTGWSGGSTVSKMLDFLWLQGRILVAKRVNGTKLWDLADRCLPEWTPYEFLPDDEIVRRASQRSLHALGVATEQAISQHFTSGRYPVLSQVLAKLEADGRIARISIRDDDKTLAGTWFISVDDLPLLERLESGAWEPRTTLLSPFDNLICNRQRTKQLFDFTYSSEIYVPKDKRRYGYYVMPILHGDRLIGRLDPAMDRKQGRLVINAVHIEPNISLTDETIQAVGSAIKELATFLGASAIVYGEQVPESYLIFFAKK